MKVPIVCEAEIKLICDFNSKYLIERAIYGHSLPYKIKVSLALNGLVNNIYFMELRDK